MELFGRVWNSSGWDLSSGMGVEPLVHVHNVLGELWANLSSAELVSVEGDTFSYNLSPAALVS
jgi:hypothetical protein